MSPLSCDPRMWDVFMTGAFAAVMTLWPVLILGVFAFGRRRPFVSERETIVRNIERAMNEQRRQNKQLGRRVTRAK